MAEEQTKTFIEEQVVAGRRLGRHVWHDPRSRNFVAQEAPVLKSVKHTRHIGPLDQGDLGSCTGNAEVGLLMTDPFYVPGRELSETDAVALYSEATHHDHFKGLYPPVDTGSSGLAVMKAAKLRGWIGAYRHAFGLHQALRALVLAPVIIGINWYEGFDTPQSSGELVVAGSVRGGHELVLDRIDVVRQIVLGMQSWGDWGKLNGRFFFKWETFDRLLHERGDVTTGALT